MHGFIKPARWLALIGIIGWVAASAPAGADQTVCRNLQAQLASVSRGGGGAQLRRYERAIISQNQQLQRARNQADNNGCSGLLASFKAQCGPIRATVAKMERNLLSLQRTKNELSGGGSAPREKARILAALGENGCGKTPPRTANRERPTGLFGRLYGDDGAQKRRKSDGGNSRNDRSTNFTAAPGRYRTMCVRTCDGYFFPIAYSSSPDLFDRDRKACESACPGTEVQLYHHRVPGEEAAEMVSSATGEPYTDLPAAFRYREPGYQQTATCQCNSHKEFSIIAGNPYEDEAHEKPVGQAPRVPEPAARPDPAEDAETRANREGGLDAAALENLLAPKVAAASPVVSSPDETASDDNGERRIRVVGPTFLPDPEAAIDLRAPDRTELR